MVDVSIVFVNYKTKDLTINAIKSVIEKTEGINYEIFVVDNNSQDGSIETIEQQFPYINIIKNPINAGFGVANNLAIKQAKGKYIFCLNTDTLLLDNAVKSMFDYMENNTEVGVCGGQLLNKDSSLQNSYGYFPTLFNIIVRFGILRNKYVFPKPETETKFVDAIIGADIFFRKSVLDEVGYFDENIFMYGEEIELCYRIKKQKYEIAFLPDVKIIHFGGSSSNNEFAFMQEIKSNFYFVYKHKIMPILFLKIYYTVKYLIAFLVSRKKIFLKGILLSCNVNRKNYVNLIKMFEV